MGVSRRPTAVPVDASVVVADVAALLAERLGRQGATAIDDALDVLVEGLALRGAVLRSVSPDGSVGELLARAGDVVHAVPTTRALRALDPDDVDLPVEQAGREVARLSVHGARPSQLLALRALAAVLGLALVAPRPLDAGDATALVQDAEADRDELADSLHDGPVQALVVARYAVDAAVRSGDVAALSVVRDAVQDALVDLRHTLWQLRPRGAVDLRTALSELSVRQVGTGAPALDLELDLQSVTELPAAAAVTAYRLVQAVAASGAEVHVRVEPTSDGCVVEIAGGSLSTPLVRWQRRAQACGATLESAPGRLRLTVARTPSEPPLTKATP